MTARKAGGKFGQPAGGRGSRSHTCDERIHVRHVLRIGVIVFVVKPVAAAAAGYIRTDHAIIVEQGLRQKIEIAAIACQAMHAYDNALISRIAPVGIRNLVKTVSGKAEQSVSEHGGN